MWYVYFLRLRNGDVYVGSTNDLRRRFASHTRGEVLSTKAHNPMALISYVAVRTEDTARELERYFKSGSGKAFANASVVIRVAQQSHFLSRISHILKIAGFLACDFGAADSRAFDSLAAGSVGNASERTALRTRSGGRLAPTAINFGEIAHVIVRKRRIYLGKQAIKAVPGGPPRRDVCATPVRNQ